MQFLYCWLDRGPVTYTLNDPLKIGKVPTSPLWVRHESFSEDPFLLSLLGAVRSSTCLISGEHLSEQESASVPPEKAVLGHAMHACRKAYGLPLSHAFGMTGKPCQSWVSRPYLILY